MLLEKLVKQHRIHLVIAHAVGFSLLVACHKRRIHFLYVFGHKPKLRCASRINLLLVTERNRSEGVDSSLTPSIGSI